jgi:hypothetical protein
MVSFIAGLVAFIKAVPIIDSWFTLLFKVYTEKTIADMKKENAEAIKKAIETGDQRPIETTIGSSNAGKPSGVPGAVIYDSIPGEE